MILCYCKAEIGDGARKIELSIDWGVADLREPWSGFYAYCSFGCMADHARDLADKHDRHVVTEGRDERFGNEVPA